MTELITTFSIGESLFGLEVMKVQEVTGSPTIIKVPLAPKFVRGLINLRGQLATALGLRELLNLERDAKQTEMSVVCRVEGNLVSLIVDAIGDVVEVNSQVIEATPETVPAGLKRFIKGIYKVDGAFLSVLDLDKIAKELSPEEKL